MTWNSKEYYHSYVDNGVCPTCRRRPVAKGKTRCAMCLYDDAERQRNRYHNKREEVLSRITERRARLQAEGKCPNCGKKKPEEWKNVLCPGCTEKNRQRGRNAYAKKHGYYKAGI